MKLIPLTQGQFAKVDDEDYDELSRSNWTADWNKKTSSFYARTCVKIGRQHKHVRMHRIIMKTPIGMKCDHIDHDTLNNQKANLRNCTNSQNMMNRKGATMHSKTGVLGVSPFHGKFRAFISDPVTHENIYLGTFKTIEEATATRKEAEVKYYGDFRNIQ